MHSLYAPKDTHKTFYLTNIVSGQSFLSRNQNSIASNKFLKEHVFRKTLIMDRNEKSSIAIELRCILKKQLTNCKNWICVKYLTNKHKYIISIIMPFMK